MLSLHSLPNMAENTRLKDLSTNVSKLLETLENDRLEYKKRFETLEDTLDSLLKQQRSPGHHHQQYLDENSGTPSTLSQQPFQVRNIKLDFP